MLLSYGAARMGASLFKELQTAVFAKVSANAIREVGSNSTLPLPCDPADGSSPSNTSDRRVVCVSASAAAFRHVLDLDLTYHTSRETGALTRYLDRCAVSPTFRSRSAFCWRSHFVLNIAGSGAQWRAGNALLHVSIAVQHHADDVRDSVGVRDPHAQLRLELCGGGARYRRHIRGLHHAGNVYVTFQRPSQHAITCVTEPRR